MSSFNSPFILVLIYFLTRHLIGGYCKGRLDYVARGGSKPNDLSIIVGMTGGATLFVVG